MPFRFLTNRSFRLLLLWLDGAQLKGQLGVELLPGGHQQGEDMSLLVKMGAAKVGG